MAGALPSENSSLQNVTTQSTAPKKSTAQYAHVLRGKGAEGCCKKFLLVVVSDDFSDSSSGIKWKLRCERDGQRHFSRLD